MSQELWANLWGQHSNGASDSGPEKNGVKSKGTDSPTGSPKPSKRQRVSEAVIPALQNIQTHTLRHSQEGPDGETSAFDNRARVQAQPAQPTLMGRIGKAIQSDSDLLSKEFTPEQMPTLEDDFIVENPKAALEAMWSRVGRDAALSAEASAIWELRVLRSVCPNVDTDRFLMCFLRFTRERNNEEDTVAAKQEDTGENEKAKLPDRYNVDKAFRRLKLYAVFMHSHQDWLLHPRLCAKSVEAFFDSGNALILRNVTKQGGTVLCLKESLLTKVPATPHIWPRAICYQWHRLCIEDPSCQDVGLTIIEDMESVGLPQLMRLPFLHTGRDARFFKEIIMSAVLPIRFNRIFVTRQGWAYTHVHNLCSRFLPAASQQRIELCGSSLDGMRSYLDPALLPKAFLGGAKDLNQCPEFEKWKQEEREAEDAESTNTTSRAPTID